MVIEQKEVWKQPLTSHKLQIATKKYRNRAFWNRPSESEREKANVTFSTSAAVEKATLDKYMMLVKCTLQQFSIQQHKSRIQEQQIQQQSFSTVLQTSKRLTAKLNQQLSAGSFYGSKQIKGNKGSLF